MRYQAEEPKEQIYKKENTFETNCKFEEEYKAKLYKSKLSEILLEKNMRLIYLSRSDNSTYSNSLYNKKIQESGDMLIIDLETGCFKTSIDLKVESRISKNIFFETQSNSCLGDKQKNGWGVTSLVDEIWYTFVDKDNEEYSKYILVIALEELRTWLNEKTGKKLRYMNYEERIQQKHNQKNITSGRLIPIVHLPENVLKKGINIETGEIIKHKQMIEIWKKI